MATAYLAVTNGSGSGWKTIGSYAAVTAKGDPTGYHFNGWTGSAVAYGMNSTLRGTGFTMPSINVSCMANFALTSYWVNYYSSTGGGVNGTTHQTGYYGDSTSTVTASANAGWHFTGWDDGGGSASRSDTIHGNAAYIAQFAQDEGSNDYALTVTNGTGDGSYSPGTNVSIVADAPAVGYHFTFWSGDTAGIVDIFAASTTINTQGGAATVVANYALDAGAEFTLTYTVSAVYINGQAMGTITGDVVQAVTDGGDGTEVTAVPLAGFIFKKWSDDVTTSARTDLNVTANANINAIFEVIQSGYIVWM